MQPESQLGREISDLLDSETRFTRIVLVSAFVGLRTILRLRAPLLQHLEHGAALRSVVGIDLGGTSREVLEELLRWGSETLVLHNALPRATFHPKAYLFESVDAATLFVGSNNLTDGGFYTNYEAATRFDFELPADRNEYLELLRPLNPFLNPNGPTVRLLDADLIRTLVARDELPSEAEARQRRSEQTQNRQRDGDIPQSPFAAVATHLPPLLPQDLRAAEPANPRAPEPPRVQRPRHRRPLPSGVLVWRKVLPRSDALQVDEGTAHVGGVRLTQARFENPPGVRIDQTTYFRNLFADYHWETETGRRRNTDQEHTFVPMRMVIRGTDHGVHNFEISHKPTGEAGQDNYTTILRWGRHFNPIIQRENLTGAELSLYEVTAGDDADFLINIV
uniref:phospholipase D family protein n=1 Tax=Cupriavidus taiwanensis TaxID=164546 RepID=UPI0018DC6B66|nr:phospholipase D family protein [Cupriavidus taiwanensis]